MAFTIFARGVPGFIYRSRVFVTGSVFTIGSAILSTRGGLASASRGALRSAGRGAIAGGHAAHLLATGINLLMTHPQKRHGVLSFHMVTTSLIWDSCSNFQIELIDVSTSRDFHRKLLRGLRKMDMTDFGVILEIAIAINRYSAGLRNRDRPMLMIYLTN